MVIIVAGGIGRSITGGQAWAGLQFLLGIEELGHEVYYLEDCGEWSSVYDWSKQEKTWELNYPASFVKQALEPYGLEDCWIYRAGDSSQGISVTDFHDVCNQADLLIIRGIPFLKWRTEYDLPRKRIFVDVDPGFTQFCYERGEPAFKETIDRSDNLFTFGLRIGDDECTIPTLGRTWHRTLPPVVLKYWPVPQETAIDQAFTTVARWRGMKNLKYNGIEYGQRDKEFSRFIDLPKKTNQCMRIAITGGGYSQLRANGWNPVDGWTVTGTPRSYQAFIQNSKAEFGIAKNLYVDTRSGWFSDRSACYLASARPTLLQDTGFCKSLHEDSGVILFSNVEEALSGIEKINNDYAKFSRCARQYAVSNFDSRIVLGNIFEIAVG